MPELRLTNQLQKTADSQYDAILELVELLQQIDDTKPLAEANATSISDNNGGRILL